MRERGETTRERERRERERERETEKPGGRGKKCEGAPQSEHTVRPQKDVKAPTKVLLISLGSASERRRAG